MVSHYLKLSQLVSESPFDALLLCWYIPAASLRTATSHLGHRERLLTLQVVALIFSTIGLIATDNKPSREYSTLTWRCCQFHIILVTTILMPLGTYDYRTETESLVSIGPSTFVICSCTPWVTNSGPQTKNNYTAGQIWSAGQSLARQFKITIIFCLWQSPGAGTNSNRWQQISLMSCVARFKRHSSFCAIVYSTCGACLMPPDWKEVVFSRRKTSTCAANWADGERRNIFYRKFRTNTIDRRR